MRSDNTKPLRSVLLALIYLAVWLAFAAVKFIADELTGSLILHVAFTMMIMPAAAFAVPFVYTRRGGQRLWLALYILAAALILYFACGYNELQPNFLAENVIFGFFGFGVGGIFRIEPLTAARQAVDNAKKLAEEKAEKEYTSIIDKNRS